MYNNVWTQSLHHLVPHEIMIPFMYSLGIFNTPIVTKATLIYGIALLHFKLT